MNKLVQYVDVLVGNEEELQKALGIEGADVSVLWPHYHFLNAYNMIFVLLYGYLVNILGVCTFYCILSAFDYGFVFVTIHLHPI